MDLVVGALPVILSKLANLLGDEYKLQRGVKDGIQYLIRELESMQAALKNVSEVPADQLDPQVKIWARNLRDMSYHIEDTLDSYMVRVNDFGKPESSTNCFSYVKYILPRKSMDRHDIGQEIERIKQEVEDMRSRRERYNVDSVARPAPAPSDPRLVALYQDKGKLVGIDRSSEEIIKLVYTEGEGTSEQKLRLVSIVGPGGMGKTTLANAVYEKLEEKFDCIAFVSVSLQPNMKQILSSILRQVTSKINDEPEDKENHKGKSIHRRDSRKHYGNTETWSEKEVIDKIRHVLEKRRYLILIDDIWDEESWKLIQCVLFKNNLGSIVITTTRNIGVANSCCSVGEVDGIVHELEPLSGGDSKQLLYYKIFGEAGCPTELKRVSRKILEKCKGWPLAINAIASVLANKQTQTVDQWSSVYNSISTGLENNQGVKDMRLILSLSYRDMPSQLRACLLYLSIFPEDHIIGRDDLIRRWIAEDLVHGTQGDNLYELGDKYFNELINRTMLQPSDVDAFGRAHACRVHDLVLEFINSLSAQEDFVTILNGQQPFPSQPDNIHRLSLRNSREEHGIPQATKKLPHVRTLVVSSRAINSMPSLSIFPILRLLELEHCTNHSIENVGNLIHLRYLRLSQQYYHYLYDDGCIKLPKEIGRLQVLQTLDLKEARIEELPSTVVQLKQLRLLEISLRKWDKRCEKIFLQWLCNLTAIEALCIFAPDMSLDFMLQLDWAPSHLLRFRACPREQTEHIFRRGSVWAEVSPFSALPRWINFSLCSSLSDLSIMVSTLPQSDLDVLADLLSLRSVDLEVVEATGTRLKINRFVGTSTGNATAFRCLEKLKYASRAAGLVFTLGAMQKLQELYLCFDLAETQDVHGHLDLGLDNLASLKDVHIEIDCRCARHSEVEAAEVALRSATDLNRNRPTLDLRLHFRGEMLQDEEEQIPEELRANKEDALLSRVGPFGGRGGRARDIWVAPHRLENITIGSGDAVDSFAFSYTDHNGQKRTAGPWGGGGGSVSTINLGPSEYLIEVYGTSGSCFGVANLVTSLTFVTNVASYGPFGTVGVDPFVLPMQSNRSIVGFFGRAGGSLDAIGFYVRQV